MEEVFIGAQGSLAIGNCCTEATHASSSLIPPWIATGYLSIVYT